MRLGLGVRFSVRGIDHELKDELCVMSRDTCILYESKENRDHKHAKEDPIRRYCHMQCFPDFPTAIARHRNHKI